MLIVTVTTGSNVSYTWTFGDGTTGSGITATHIHPAVGIYTAVITADNSMGVLTKTTKVTITGTPELSISKNGPATAEIGDAILYTLTITNSGNDKATGLAVTDVIPAGAAYTNGGTREGDLVSWTVDSLPPIQSIQVQFYTSESFLSKRHAPKWRN